MSDSARNHKQYPVRLVLPPRECPRWVRPPNDLGSLLYHSWGKRRFGKNPILVSRHEGWSQVLVVKGTPVLQIGEKRFTTSAGKMLLIPPDVPYGWTDTNETNQTDQLSWIWNSPPSFFNESWKKEVWYSIVLSPLSMKRMLRFHLDLRREIEVSDSWTPNAIEGIRKQIDSEWGRSETTTAAASDSDFRFELAIRWMNQRIEETKPIQQLQAYLQVSPASLKRLFLMKSGKSPQEYFQALKFSKAKLILESEGNSIKSVALLLGYRHVSDFTRAFQRYHPFPPSFYSNQTEKNSI